MSLNRTVTRRRAARVAYPRRRARRRRARFTRSRSDHSEGAPSWTFAFATAWLETTCPGPRVSRPRSRSRSASIPCSRGAEEGNSTCSSMVRSCSRSTAKDGFPKRARCSIACPIPPTIERGLGASSDARYRDGAQGSDGSSRPSTMCWRTRSAVAGASKMPLR